MRLGISLLLFSAACTRLESSGTPPADDAGPAASASDAGGDADLPPATGRGFISITSHPDLGDEVFAVFYSKQPTGGVPFEWGACRYSPPPDPDAGLPTEEDVDPDAVPVVTSAGTVTVSAGTRAATLSFDANVSGYYPKKLSGGDAGIGPETPIHVKATGATVPAFELTALVAPELALQTRLEDGIAADAPFELAWETPPVPGAVVLSLVAERGGQIRCHAKTESGRVVVPQDQVKSLLESGANVTAEIRVSTNADVRAGAYLVSAQHEIQGQPTPLPVR